MSVHTFPCTLLRQQNSLTGDQAVNSMLWSADYASCCLHSALSMEEMIMTKSSKVILGLRASMSGHNLDQLSHSEVLLARETVFMCSQVTLTAVTSTIAAQGSVHKLLAELS